MDDYILDIVSECYPISEYKKYTVKLDNINVVYLNVSNKKLNLLGNFRLISSYYRFKSYKVYLVLSDKRVLLEKKKECSINKKESEIYNNGYSISVDNSRDIIIEFNFSDIDVSGVVEDIRIEIDFFYNIFLESVVRGYKEIKFYKKPEIELILPKEKCSYFYNNLLDNSKLILDGREFKYNFMIDSFVDIEKNEYLYFYENDVGNLFYNEKKNESIVIKIINNSIKRVILENLNEKERKRECKFSYYNCNGEILDSNINFCIKNVEIVVEKSVWYKRFIDILGGKLTLNSLDNFYRGKNVLLISNELKRVELKNLYEINNYELIFCKNSINKIELLFKNYVVNIDFNNLCVKNLGRNVINEKKFKIRYILRFYGNVFGIGNIEIIPKKISCFTNTCYINTENGFRNIIELKRGDKVRTFDNRLVEIKNIFKSKIKEGVCVIPVDYYGENKPILDTYISRYHNYKVNGKWTNGVNENLKIKYNENLLIYYHVETPEYLKDNLVVNGIEMESWDGIF